MADTTKPLHTQGEWTTDGRQIKAGLKTEGRPLGINTIATINQGGLDNPGGDPKANADRIVKAVNMLANLERLKYVRPEEGNPHLSIEDRIETAEMSCRGWSTVQYKIDMHDELISVIDCAYKLLVREGQTGALSDDMYKLLKQAEKK